MDKRKLRKRGKKVVMSVYKKILAIMADIESIGKDCFVETGGYHPNGKPKGYYAVTHDHVAKKIHPLCVKHGLAILPTILEKEVTRYQTEKNYKGNITVKDVYEVRATVSTRFQDVENEESFWDCVMFAYGLDSQDKASGKAVSMAVKYAILKTFQLESGDQEELRDLELKKEQEKKAPIKNGDAKKESQTKADLTKKITMLCAETTSHMTKDEKIQWLKDTLLIDNFNRLQSKTSKELQEIVKKLEGIKQNPQVVK